MKKIIKITIILALISMIGCEDSLDKITDFKVSDNKKLTQEVAAGTTEGPAEVVSSPEDHYKIGRRKFEAILSNWNGYHTNQSLLKTHARDAIKDLDKAIELNPEYSDAYFLKGVLHGDIGEYMKSAQSFRKVIAINPKYPNVYFNMGKTLFRFGSYDQAIKYFEKSTNPLAKEEIKKATLRLDGTVEQHMKDAYAKQASRDYKGAITSWDLVISMDEDYQNAHLNRGINKALLKDYSEAIVDIEKELEFFPDNKHAKNQLAYVISLLTIDQLVGLAYQKQRSRDYEGAISYWSLVIEKDEDYQNAHLNRGTNKGLLKRYQEAKIDMEKELEFFPDNEHAKTQLAYVTSKLPQPAEPKFTKEDYFSEGKNEYRSKNYNEAIQSLSKALEIDPNFVDALYVKANAHFNRGENGDYAEAVTLYESVLSIDSSYKNTESRLKYAQGNM